MEQASSTESRDLIYKMMNSANVNKQDLIC